MNATDGGSVTDSPCAALRALAMLWRLGAKPVHNISGNQPRKLLYLGTGPFFCFWTNGSACSAGGRCGAQQRRPRRPGCRTTTNSEKGNSCGFWQKHTIGRLGCRNLRLLPSTSNPVFGDAFTRQGRAARHDRMPLPRSFFAPVVEQELEKFRL